MNQHPTLAFIGAGNMARAIIGGLISNGFPAAKIRASSPTIDRLADLKSQGLFVTTDNAEAMSSADIVVLAVKPQMLKAVLQPLAAAAARNKPLFISVAAGITSQSINKWLGGDQAIVRCMPNTPALVKMGANGLFANASVSEAQRSQAVSVLSATGLTLWVEQEEQLHAVTAVSGSAPAYYFLFMEAMIAAAEKQGLSKEVATQLTLQTARGAAEMALQSDVDPAELRRRVTSPKGTTEQAILSFQANHLDRLVEEAMQACAARSVSMAKELGDD
ncbi:pyrroline-5-carboxylate reductase [Neptunomonas qingdaonensis]|uniref:Pyrroline-5-carboxylate reductase n=1 Tax=Neptunomonas qingdaonensis TaxID=1045558 RepID=A0A1I2M0G5_9GAMM|nr:pyrroline-5-carboxylate reductase [Neptunomonas qingdaonensis]SFF84993.1 pyrroline-5-carboxylate reductase [Neptunomonas qingdaonensis]